MNNCNVIIKAIYIELYKLLHYNFPALRVELKTKRVLPHTEEITFTTSFNESYVNFQLKS